MYNTIMRVTSRLVGYIMKIKYPYPIQLFFNYIFIKITKINLSDFKPISEYKTLQDLFTRSLIHPRSFSLHYSDIIAPCDSTIIHTGTISNNSALQIKEKTYSVNELLWVWHEHINHWLYMNFYLAPYNYHHFHSPIDCLIHSITHIPGTLRSVRPSKLSKKSIYDKNERVILECETLYKKHKFYMVCVWALNVWNIIVYKEQDLKTNKRSKKNKIILYDDPITIKKWEDLWYFALWSSVILIMDPHGMDIRHDQLLQKVSFGDTIAQLK